MNIIPTIQNEEEALQLLRARTHTHSRATLIMFLQLVPTVILPIAGTVAAIVWPGLGVYVAAASLIIVIADPWIIDPSYKLRLKRAAKIAEQFDCRVLDLSWDQFTVGDKVEAENIHTAAKCYTKRHDDTKLRDWYPTNIGAAPLHLARITCQRTNLCYDSKIRRGYGSIIWITAVLIVAGCFFPRS